MLFRPTRREASAAGGDVEALVAEAERVFGRRPQLADVSQMARVEVEGFVFLYDPDQRPPFILAPECDVCGSGDADQFPLEEWAMLGTTVLAQARASCRDCRFLGLLTD